MPSLHVLGHVTPLSGDELQFGTLLVLVLRLIQVTLAGALLGFAIVQRQGRDGDDDSDDETLCEEDDTNPLDSWICLYVVHSSVALMVPLIGMGLGLMTIHISRKGTPTEPEQRNATLQRLCCIRLTIMDTLFSILFVYEMVLIVLLVVWHRRQDDIMCSDLNDSNHYIPWLIILIALMVTHLLDVLAMCGALTYFCCCLVGSSFLPSMIASRYELKTARQKWKATMACCFGCSSLLTCCVFGGKDAVLLGDFGPLAEVLNDYFGLTTTSIPITTNDGRDVGDEQSTNDDDGDGGLDVTPSDILCGLIMVMREQRLEILESKTRLREQHQIQQRRLSQSISNSQQQQHSSHNISSTTTTGAGSFIARRPLPDQQQQQQQRLQLKQSSSHSLPPSCEEEFTRELGVPLEEKGPPPVPMPLRSFSHPELSCSSDIIPNDDNESTNFNKKRSTNSAFPAIHSRILCETNARDVYCIAEASRFLTVAQSTYSWLSYVLESPTTACCTYPCRVMHHCVTHDHGADAEDPDRIVGDYRWKSHTAAMKAVAKLRDEDIVYASFVEGIERTPYMITLDHEWKTVVVSIRGTLSLESVLADLTMIPNELVEWGKECQFDGAGKYCHAGMLACTEWLYRDLQRHGRLDKALCDTHTNYRLRIVGHSLGAGISCILSLFLRSKYPNLRCLAFSPPGCVFSKNLAEECEQWVTSYVLDADWIPRLSIDTFETLRDDILKMICRINVPKQRVLNHWSCDGVNDIDELREANNELIVEDYADVKDSRFKRQVDCFLAFQAKQKEAKRATYIELVAPGQFLQLFRTTGKRNQTTSSSRDDEEDPQITLDKLDSGRDTGSHSDYVARWVDREYFDRIVLSSHLMLDHNPVKLKLNVQQLAEQFQLQGPTYMNLLQGQNV